MQQAHPQTGVCSKEARQRFANIADNELTSRNAGNHIVLIRNTNERLDFVSYGTRRITADRLADHWILLAVFGSEVLQPRETIKTKHLPLSITGTERF